MCTTCVGSLSVDSVFDVDCDLVLCMLTCFRFTAFVLCGDEVCECTVVVGLSTSLAESSRDEMVTVAMDLYGAARVSAAVI